MSLFRPCSSCGSKAPGKNANVTWAWYDAAQNRQAYRQLLCITCFAMNIAPLEVDTRDSTLTCPVCHTDASDDLDPTYCTFYAPGLGRVQLELPTCGPCAVRVRIRAQEGATKLEDDLLRGQGTQAPQLTPTAWEQLGIQPR